MFKQFLSTVILAIVFSTSCFVNSSFGNQFDEFESIVESQKMLCIFRDPSFDVMEYNYRYDGTNLFVDGKKRDDVSQKPGKSIFLWTWVNHVPPIKIKHFIDFENTKAILKPLEGGMNVGRKFLGTCLPQ